MEYIPTVVIFCQIHVTMQLSVKYLITSTLLNQLSGVEVFLFDILMLTLPILFENLRPTWQVPDENLCKMVIFMNTEKSVCFEVFQSFGVIISSVLCFKVHSH